MDAAKMQARVKLLNVFFMVFSLEVRIDSGRPAGLHLQAEMG